MANSTKNTYKPSKKGNYMPVIRMEDGGNVSELNYSERREYIEENYAPFITEAQMIFSIWDSSIEYDYKADRKEVVNKIIESYKELGDYTEKTLSQETIYEIKDWDLIRRDIDPETDEVIGETNLKEISSDNTYNFSYKGLVDLNWKVYNDEEYDRYFYVVTPHLGGDILGNYGDAIILEGSDKEELFYRFYEGFISGGASFYFKFKDGSEIGFDSEQDSDVFNFRVSESFEPTGMAQKYLNDFEKFDSWKGDEFLEETIDIYLMRKGIAPKMMAGGSLNDETPKAYIQILGYDEGKWFNLTDYSDGQDVIDGIYDLMNDLNKELGGNREEYAVTDYEGFGDDLYDEYMGANEFDEIIEAYEKYQSSDFPADVISSYKNDSGRSNDTLSEIIDQMENNFFGKYENLNDFGYEMVEQGVYSPSDNDVFITDTDKRIIAGEESDASIDGMSFDDLLKIAETTKSDYEDEKSELEDKISNIESEINDLNELQKSVDDDSEYEKISEEVEEKEIELNDLEIELNSIDGRYEDKAREEARDVFYDEIYDKLDNDLSSWLEDYGYTSDLSSLSFLSVDYEKIGEELSADYLVVEFDGNMYFFNNYKKGGRIMASKRKPKYAYYIVESSTKKLVSGYPTKAEAIEQRKLLIQQYPSMRFEIYTLANLESKTNLDVYAKKDYVELSTLDKIKKVSVDALRYGKDKFGQAQMFLQKNDVKGRINRGARRVWDKTRQGAGWVQNQWREADFGDGTGKATFFADGGELQSLQESLLNAEKNYRKAQQSERVGIITATELEKSKQKYESIRTKINDWYASKPISENKLEDGDMVDADYSYQGNTFFNGEYKPVYKKDSNYYIKYYNPTHYSHLANEEDIKNYDLVKMFSDGGGTAGLSEVSPMLPNPLPMSTIIAMANGGSVDSEIRHIERRIKNLEDISVLMNDDDKKQITETINSLKLEKQKLENNKEGNEINAKKSFSFFGEGGVIKLPKDKSKVHFTDDQNREYDGVFIKEENGNASMFLIGFSEESSDFRFPIEIVDWHYLDDGNDDDAHKKHEDSETAEEEIAEHEYDVYDNKRMLENQANEIEHHSEELSEQVAKTKKVPAWVIAKMERATTDLSDITHYLDGENKMANGGNVGDVNYEIIPLPSSEKFIIVQVTNIGNKEDENIIRDFNGQVMKFDSINSAQKFIDNIDIKYPYGVAKANVGAILMASQLYQQQQQQSQQKQPQIVYYIPQPNEQFQDEVIIQNIPEMEHGGEAESPVINDFCMTNLIELANDIQSVRYFLTDRFKESDFESEKYKGKLIIVFKEPASVSVVNALSQFIENAVDCHHIFEQSVNVSGTEPNSLSINLLTDKYSDREFKKGGKVYDFAPKKINLEKTKKITTDLGDYNLGLITNDFVYFVNSQEGDENASTIMYNKKGELLSDNYFASSDLFEKLESGDTFEFIHPDIEAYRQEIINGN